MKQTEKEGANNQYWIFTFGCGRDIYGDRAGKHVRIYADSAYEARQKMCEKYSTKWGFQYSAEEWEDMKNNPDRWWDMEEELEVIE